MEIGVPTDVRHVAHVTFDRFHGFLGLPLEFEPEVARKVPSASVNVFGVSAQSMKCSYDSRGNSVPTILLQLQRHLYAQGGLQAEGIFRINPENSQEEHVREQLNNGLVPDGIEVHCLAGLIKAWFRELPSGVLDSLAPDQVMQCRSEDEYAALVKLLPPTEAALLDWAINLMADVVQEKHHNKMNSRNIAMVFAPNMTQMDDPLTALVYAVQVMNFLKALIERTLRKRQLSITEYAYASCPDNSVTDYAADVPELVHDTASEGARYSTDARQREAPKSEDLLYQSEIVVDDLKVEEASTNTCKSKSVQKGNLNNKKVVKKANNRQTTTRASTNVERRGDGIISHINSRAERIVEAWR